MYDTIIVGCGVAGLTAAIYLARANKKVLMLEKEGIGGQIASSPKVENYPGFQSISGMDLANALYEQVLNLGVEIELEEVVKIVPGKTKKVVTTDNEYETKTIILATGSKYRRLNLDDEEDLIGNGISFCVSCDGAFYKDKVVAVVGGGNSAAINAISLSDLCKKVYIVQNLDFLTCEEKMKEDLSQKKNIEIIYHAEVKKLDHDENGLTGIEILENGKPRTISLDGMFISIGQTPATESFASVIPCSSDGYFLSTDTTTKESGIFVAGDCRTKKIKQLTMATADGTQSAIEAIDYLSKEA